MTQNNSLIIIFFGIIFLSSLALADNQTNSTFDYDNDTYNSTIDCNDNNSNLFLNITGFIDLDGDGFTNGQNIICTNGTLPTNYLLNNNPLDCDDSQIGINPNMTEVMYNSLDDDCKSNTKDTLELMISPSKTSYNIGEQVDYIIIGSENSNITISLDSPNNYYNYQANYVEQDMPILDSVLTTSKVGMYKLNAVIKNGIFSETKNVSFQVINSIESSVTGEDNILINETLQLAALATGGIAPYTYSWNLDDGNVKTGSSITHKYAKGDEYTILLTITDSQGNIKTKDIDVKVKNIYEVTFVVKDSNDKLISGVEVSSSNSKTLTGTNGIAKIKAIEGKNEFFIYKAGYELTSLSKNIYEIETINVKLLIQDNTAPTISLEKKTIETNEKIALINYNVVDESETTCTIFTNDDGSEWWNELELKEKITDKRNFEINNLNEGETYFKIECVDSEKNSAFSEIGTIKYLKIDDSKKNENTEYLDKVELELLNLKSLDITTSKIYEVLNVKSNLQIAKKELSNYEGRVYGLINENCFGQGCDDRNAEEEIKKLDENLEKIKHDTIYSVNIIDKKEIIKYPLIENVLEVLTPYLEIINKSLSKREIENLGIKNLELQSFQNILSKSYMIQIKYLDEKVEEKIIVIKEIALNTSSSKQTLIEYIPDKSEEDIKFLVEYDSLGNNLYELNKDSKRIAYLVGDDSSINDLSDSWTLLIDTIPKKSTPLGFFIIDINAKENVKSILIITIFLIVILTRLFFFFDLHKKLKYNFGKSKNDYHQMNMLINDCLDYLDTGDYNKAVLIYKEIRMTYENIDNNVKSKIYEPIINLVKVLDEKFLNKNIEEKNQDNLKAVIPKLSADLRNKFAPLIEAGK